MMEQYDVVIIGGGPAGYSAALYNARNARSVLVIEQLSAGGQMATTGNIENYPGFDEGIDGFDLAEKMQNQAEQFGAETMYETVVELKLTENPKKVITTDGTILAKTVILATGAHPRELGLSNEDQLRGRGVAYCATCDGMMFKNKDVVIVGGGNSAIADALYLSKICHSVTLIHRRDELRASRVYEQQLQKSQIHFIWNSQVVEILANQHVTGVKVLNKLNQEITEINCDGVFVAIGRVPDTQLVKGQIELNKSGYIVADESTRTNIPGVFAIGDVRQKALRQVVTAVSDGAVSSHYIEEYFMEQGE
jgi:thioredoxin reductase (NADPH)